MGREQHNGIKTVIDQSDFTEETSPSCSYEILQLFSRLPNLMLISLSFQVRDDQLKCLQIASYVVGLLCKDFQDQLLCSAVFLLPAFMKTQHAQVSQPNRFYLKISRIDIFDPFRFQGSLGPFMFPPPFL